MRQQRRRHTAFDVCAMLIFPPAPGDAGGAALQVLVLMARYCLREVITFHDAHRHAVTLFVRRCRHALLRRLSPRFFVIYTPPIHAILLLILFAERMPVIPRHAGHFLPKPDFHASSRPISLLTTDADTFSRRSSSTPLSPDAAIDYQKLFQRACLLHAILSTSVELRRSLLRHYAIARRARHYYFHYCSYHITV